MTDLNDELQKKIDETLEQCGNDNSSVSDLFNVIRWAQQGWLVRKEGELKWKK